MPKSTEILGVLITCRICERQVYVCKPCYRGQRYCSNQECKDFGYSERRRVARKRYAIQPEAKLDHRDRNKQYRVRKKLGLTKKIVMDTSSSDEEVAVVFNAEATQSCNACVICGQACSSLNGNGGFSENLELLTLLSGRRRWKVNRESE